MTRKMMILVAFVSFFSLTMSAVVSAQGQQLPTEDEIRWRVVLESNPSVGDLADIVVTSREPFAGWAFEKLTNFSKSSLGGETELISVLAHVGYASKNIYAVLAERLISSQEIYFLISSLDHIEKREEKDFVAREILSRNKPPFYNIEVLLYHDVSVIYKQEAAKKLLEGQVDLQGDYISTEALVAIIRDVPEPYKEQAFIYLINKPWDRVVEPIYYSRNLNSNYEGIEEPYRSLLRVIADSRDKSRAEILK